MSNWRFALTVIPLLIILALIALNLLLYRQGRQYYLQLNETRLDPLGLSCYPILPTQKGFHETDLPKIVFFGDSRAAAWPSPNLRQFEFINRGIEAQTSVQAVRRFDYHVEPLEPRVVVVQIGINDLKTIPLFPDRKESIIHNCRENIGQIVAKSTEIGANVILTTIFPCGKVPIERRFFWSDDIALAINEVNAYIRSLAGEKVIVFNAFSILTDSKGSVRPDYSKDLLHLNATGYEMLNTSFVNLVTTVQWRRTD
jgi:lysophospholipase L1-like esterase